VPIYHETVVYTNALGQSFYSSGNYSNTDPNLNKNILLNEGLGKQIVQAAEDAQSNTPSAWGVLTADINKPLTAASTSGVTVGANGNAYESEVVASGPDLSSRWAAFNATESSIVSQNLTYSPYTQNSNSLATAGFLGSGITPPSDTSLFVPGGPFSPPVLGPHWAPGTDSDLAKCNVDSLGETVLTINDVNSTGATLGSFKEVEGADGSTLNTTLQTGTSVIRHDSAVMNPDGSQTDNLSGFTGSGGVQFQQAANTANGQTYVTISGNGDVTFVSNAKVTLADGTQAEIAGASDTILANSNAICTVTGLSDSVSTTGSSNEISLVGSGDSCVSSWLGSDNQISLLGPGQQATLGGAMDQLTANGDNDTIYLQGSTESATIWGSGDVAATLSVGTGNTIFAHGSSESATLSGTGDKLVVTGANDSANLQGTLGQATFSGDNDVVTTSWIGSSNAVALLGGSETATLAGASDTGTIQGTNAIIYLQGTSENAALDGVGDVGVTVWSGSKNALLLNGSSEQATLAGQGDSVTINADGDSANLQGTLGTATLNGVGNSATTAWNGSQNSVLLVGMSGSCVLAGATDSANVSGSNCDVNMQGTSDSAILLGDGDTGKTSWAGKDNALFLEGTDQSGVLAGTSDTATVSAPSDSIELEGAQGIVTLTGAGDTALSLWVGTSNSILMQGPDESGTLGGPKDTATLSASDDSITLQGTYEVATIAGPGDIGVTSWAGSNNGLVLSGSATVATLQGQNDTATLGSDNQTANVYGTGEAVTISGANDIASIASAGADTIDGNDTTTVTIAGNGQTGTADIVNLTGGTVQIADNVNVNVVGNGVIVNGGEEDNIQITGNNNTLASSNPNQSLSNCNITLDGDFNTLTLDQCAVTLLGGSGEDTIGGIGTNQVFFEANDAITLPANTYMDVAESTGDFSQLFYETYDSVAGAVSNLTLFAKAGGQVLSPDQVATDFLSDYASLIAGPSLIGQLAAKGLLSGLTTSAFSQISDLSANLLGGSTGGTSSTDGLEALLTSELGAVGQSSIAAITSQGVATLTGLVFASAAQKFGVTGLVGNALTQTGVPIAQQLVTNLNVVNSTGDWSHLLDYMNAANIESGLGTAVGKLLGQKLGSGIVSINSVGQGLLASLGGAEGAKLGAAGGVALATDLSATVATTLGTDAIVTGITDAVLDLVLPGIGAFLGQILGSVAGKEIYNFLNDITGGLFGKLFSKGKPWDYQNFAFDVSQNGITAPASLNFTKNTNADLRNAVDSLSNAVTAGFSDVVATLGGTVVPSPTAIWDVIAWVNNSKPWGANDFQVEVHGNSSNHVNAAGNPASIVRIAIDDDLRQVSINGGNPILVHAFQEWQATPQPAQGDSLDVLESYLQVAQEYIKYSQNTIVINSLMAVSPDSAYTSGWLYALGQAQALGLNGFVTSQGSTASEFGSDNGGSTSPLPAPTNGSDGSGVQPGSLPAAVAASDTTPDEDYVSAVYHALLGRYPDALGQEYWASQLDQGMPRPAFVSALDHSAEYFATIVKPVYVQFLGRNADATGLSYWVSLMQSGLNDEALEARFIGSSEYYQHSGNTDRAWLDAMYSDLLGRRPDIQGETYWVDQLANGADRSTVALGFAASPEREGQHIVTDYQVYLERTPSASEVSYWVSQFKTGSTNEGILTGFLSSDEYFAAQT
jgi:hypothetical protein